MVSVSECQLLGESGTPKVAPKVAIDHKSEKSEPLFLTIGSSKAEAAQASATSSPVLSFELEVNEIKLCLDCINRECLNFGVFVFSCVELFYASHADNYPVQMKLSGF